MAGFANKVLWGEANSTTAKRGAFDPFLVTNMNDSIDSVIGFGMVFCREY